MPRFSEIVQPKIRPQDDFYRHVNSKWLKKTQIPPQESVWGAFWEIEKSNLRKLRTIAEDLLLRKNLKQSSIEQKVRDFYLSGMNLGLIEERGLKKIKAIFRRIEACKDTKDFSKLLGELHLMGINALWMPYVEPDEKNNKKYSLRFFQAGLSLPDRDYYTLQNSKIKKIRTALESHIPKMFQHIGHEFLIANIGKQILGFEKKIALSSMTATQLRDIEAQYNKFSYKQLRETFPNINWPAYFVGLSIRPPKYVVINQPKFFRQIDSLFAHGDIALRRSYLKWQLLRLTSGLLGDGIAKANFEFYGRTLLGVKKMQPRWKRTIRAVDNCIGEALGKLYISEYFPPLAKRRMEILVEDLKVVFAQRIKALPWMQPSTKKYALRKLQKTTIKIGYPKKLKTYRGLKVTPESYFDNYIKANIYNSKFHLAKLNKPVDREEWGMTPPTMNAYSNPNLNEIVFPAGILQPPLFDLGADDAINYGGIGYVIGHEMTHGFDDQGGQYDANGNLKSWQSTKDKTAFKKKAQPLVRQADSFEALPGQNLNGRLTLGENIADLGGVEVAFQAFQKAITRSSVHSGEGSYTPEQRFFLNLARVERMKIRKQKLLQMLLTDPHPPHDFRVNNTLRNMDAFYSAFGVGQDDKMYLPPKQRVKIW